MRLCLIRHGESEENAAGAQIRAGDPPLTERGHRQARHTGQRIAAEGLELLYCGPLLRNLQTAAHIYEASGIQPTLLPPVFEVGANPNLWSPRDIAKQFPMIRLENGWRGRLRSLPETFEEACERVRGIERWLRQQYEDTDTRVGLVTHGTLADLLISYCLNMKPGAHARFSSANCAVHYLDVRPNVAKLLRLNDFCHIPEGDRS